jgi:hypothetical protein
VTESRRSRRRFAEPRRPLALVAVAVAVALLTVVSVRHPSSNPVPSRSSVARIVLDAESSAFYCGGLERVAGQVESDVAIADLASTPRVVEVTTTNELNEVSLRQIEVTPGNVVHLSPASLVGGSLEAVSIVASGGDIAATEAIRGVNGTAVAPCLTRAASSWWLTGGSTEKGQSFVLSVFNPYASQAVFSVTLQTSSGFAVPPSAQGIVLGPHQLAAIDVHRIAPDQSPITTHVDVSDGDVVVYAIGRSTEGASLISLLPGSPAPSNLVSFPVGSSAGSRTTQLVLANPGSTPVVASVRVHAPPACSAHCPAPFYVTLTPGATSTLALSPSTRVPAGTGMATEVAANGAGIVAVQRVIVHSAVGQSAPLDDAARVGAERLVLVNPLATGLDDVGMVNPTSEALHVSLATVSRHGPVAIGRQFTIKPHQSLLLGPGELRGAVDGVLVLVADGPLSASADVRGALGGSGVLVAVPAM